jgi:hypothetical protein
VTGNLGRPHDLMDLHDSTGIGPSEQLLTMSRGG